MDNGWIKLHRSVRSHWIRKNAEYYAAFIDMLMLCNHKDTKVLINGELIDCMRGQSLRSLESWSYDFGKWWTIQKVRTFFRLLERDGMCEVEGLKKTTRLTICNYDTYQNDQQADNKQTTRRQHADNNKQECKECKNEKKKNIGGEKRSSPPSLSKDIINNARKDGW